jgi:hypothetical protein
MVEGHLMGDHVHMVLSIPPKYAVAQVVGFIKGKSAIHIARTYGGQRENFSGQNFWARGYYVSTIGKDEMSVERNVKEILKACPKIRLKIIATVTTANIDELEDLITWGLNLSCEVFHIREVFFLAQSPIINKEEMGSLILKPGQFDKLRASLVRYEKSAKFIFSDTQELDEIRTTTKAMTESITRIAGC